MVFALAGGFLPGRSFRFHTDPDPIPAVDAEYGLVSFELRQTEDTMGRMLSITLTALFVAMCVAVLFGAVAVAHS